MAPYSPGSWASALSAGSYSPDGPLPPEHLHLRTLRELIPPNSNSGNAPWKRHGDIPLVCAAADAKNAHPPLLPLELCRACSRCSDSSHGAYCSTSPPCSPYGRRECSPIGTACCRWYATTSVDWSRTSAQRRHASVVMGSMAGCQARQGPLGCDCAFLAGDKERWGRGRGTWVIWVVMCWV